MAEKTNVHEGHRQRLKAQFERFGLDVMDDVKVLELLLFYSQPRRDTNVTAHLLLDKFHTLKNVLTAPIGMLEEVPGVGHSTAVYIRLIGESARRMNIVRPSSSAKINSVEDAVQYPQPLFDGATEEKLYIMMIDKNKHVIDCKLFGEGIINKVTFDVSRIVQELIYCRAIAIVIAHNHVVNDPTPSSADRASTTLLKNTLSGLGIEIVDHLIFAEGRCFSMFRSNFIDVFRW